MKMTKVNGAWRERNHDDRNEIKPVIQDAVENLTPNQLAEIRASQEVQKSLGMQRPAPRARTQDEFSKYFEKVWGAGWKVGYYSKPDKPCICPFTDPDERRIWNDGVVHGSTAREVIEPRPEDRENIQEKEAA